MRMGLTFRRGFPPSEVIRFAGLAEDGGLDDLWLIEDCFFTSGPSLAAAALTSTNRIRVGIGILPAVVRHPAVTAMEVATLAGLGPGRFTVGIGHGVQEWMAQMGLKPDSPLTALEETMHVIRRLLNGEQVTFDGETVTLDHIRLEVLPEHPVPLLAGVRGPKSMASAGRVADGVILAEPTSPAYVTWARQHARAGDDFEIVAFSSWIVIDDGNIARTIMSGMIAEELAHPHAGWKALPFFDDLIDRFTDGGAEAIASMPREWWHDIGAIGDRADAHAYLDRLEAVGVDAVTMYPAPEVDFALSDLELMIDVSKQRRQG
jgi:alkanesulfonate monooxygenase SsuD/methylene tetrahydromethanopterin reductase-like flavin-dependent oxidoreductase (luciferase family)